MCKLIMNPCPKCGRIIDEERDMYIPERDWYPSYYDPDSGGNPITVNCKCGYTFSYGWEWDDFVKEWNKEVGEQDG